MHIETTAGQLKKALNMVRPVVAGWKPSPILSCVRLSAGKGGAACVEASDTDIDLRVDIAASDASHGAAFVLDHAVLTRIAGNLPTEETVRIEGFADGNAVLTFRASRYRLAAMPATDWPETGPLGDPVWSGEVTGGFVDALRFGRPCISADALRYYINGVCLDGREMVSTDGARMATCASGLDLPDGARPIVPRDAVRLMLAAREVSHLKIGTVRIAAQMPGMRLTAKLIDGTFPDWRRVVPGAVLHGKAGLMRIDLDRAETMEALTRLMAMRDAIGPSTGVVLARGHVALGSLGTDIGLGEEHLRKAEWRWHGAGPESLAMISRGPMVVQFNTGYLREALAAWRGAERVTMWVRADPEAKRIEDPATITVDADAPPPVTVPEDGEPVRRLVLMPQRRWDHRDGVVTDIASRMAGAAGALEAAE